MPGRQAEPPAASAADRAGLVAAPSLTPELPQVPATPAGAPDADGRSDRPRRSQSNGARRPLPIADLPRKKNPF
jgi:hypothetical protein